MSTVRTNNILDASGGNTATINSMTPTADSLQGFRNRIINGDMGIDQRNAGASITPANEAYTLDRWSAYTNGAGVYTVQRSSTAPAGFVNSLLCTVTTVDSSVSGSDYYMLQQRIEGLNVSDLGWGTANAKTVTISFWVRSSITGTYTVKLGNSAPDRSYVATYSISSANTWEQKTITIAGDTSGTWLTTNGIGIEIRFAMAIGSSFTTSSPNQWVAANVFGSTTASNNWIGTNGATFYITGVQLEVGSVATPFERIDYGRELALCQRYYQRATNSSGGIRYLSILQAFSTAGVYGVLLRFPVTFRATPSISISSSFGGFYNSSSATASTSQPTSINTDGQAVQTGDWGGGSGLTAGQGLVCFWNANSYIEGSAEL
jgi:hypothetical protein